MLQDITGARVFEAVTPADTGDVLLRGATKKPPKGIYVGGAGDVAAIDYDGTTVTFVGVAAGTVLPIRPRDITTASTATNMVALY